MDMEKMKNTLIEHLAAEYRQKAAELVEMMKSGKYDAEKAISLSNDLSELKDELMTLLAANGTACAEGGCSHDCAHCGLAASEAEQAADPKEEE